MTASCCQTTETLGESIAVALREKKPVMLASLAERFGVSELEVARALPDEARAFAGKDAFDTVWQVLASWENATFIMAHLGSVIEIKGKIPEGRPGTATTRASGRPVPTAARQSRTPGCPSGPEISLPRARS